MPNIYGIEIGSYKLLSSLTFYRLNIFFLFSSFMAYTIVSIDNNSFSNNTFLWIGSILNFTYFVTNAVSSGTIINRVQNFSYLGYYIIGILVGIVSMIITSLILNFLKEFDYYYIIGQLILTGITIFFQITYPLIWYFIVTNNNIEAYERIRNPSLLLNESNNQSINLSEKLLSDENKENILGECCICFEEFNKNNKIVKLACKHIYHQHCIEAWIKKKKDCPICRTNNIV